MRRRTRSSCRWMGRRSRMRRRSLLVRLVAKLTSFAAASARYVRVLGVTRATQWGISFWDAQVFGPGT